MTKGRVLLAFLPEGPQKKIFKNKIIKYEVKYFNLINYYFNVCPEF
jgi:hypothetical protein